MTVNWAIWCYRNKYARELARRNPRNHKKQLPLYLVRQSKPTFYLWNIKVVHSSDSMWIELYKNLFFYKLKLERWQSGLAPSLWFDKYNEVHLFAGDLNRPVGKNGTVYKKVHGGCANGLMNKLGEIILKFYNFIRSYSSVCVCVCV